MNANEKYLYWLKHAQYDLDTADSMYQTGRWVYVAFMCQQAIEKLVKGIYGLYIDFDSIPRTHNISKLVSVIADKLPQNVSEETYSLFDLLARYYLNNRYPNYMDELTLQTNEDSAKTLLSQTKEVFAWLQTMTL